MGFAVLMAFGRVGALVAGYAALSLLAEGAGWDLYLFAWTGLLPPAVSWWIRVAAVGLGLALLLPALLLGRPRAATR